MASSDNIATLFEQFSKLNIMIIGDVMIDAYLWGDVDRISPEAPVPIVNVTRRANRLGGAANVALNVQAMGARAILCSVTGNDDKAKNFEELLEDNKLDTMGILRSEDRITTTKFRVLGNNVQLLRVDEETNKPLAQPDMDNFRHMLEKMLEGEKIHAIIFQDYDKGVITPEIIDFVTDLAASKNIPVTVDPKKRNFESYRNLTLFKPNLKELKEGLGVEFPKEDMDSIRKAARKIHTQRNIDIVLTTLSENGVYVSQKSKDGKYEEHHLPAHIRQISDVSGAGDTVISVASLCLAIDMPVREMAAASNLAGGQVCERVGVVPVDKTKLMDELEDIIQ